MRGRPIQTLACSSIAALALGAAAVTAQTSGSIRGDVTDQNGDPVPGAQVTAEDSRGVGRTVMTGAAGGYTIPSLATDDYSVTVTLDGFQGQMVENVRVGIGSIVDLDFELSVAAVEEVVNVTSTPILEVTNNAIGTNYTAEFMEDLPTQRNFWDMMAVAPGVSQQSEGSTSMTAFGSSITSNSWRIDGLDVTSTDTGNAWWYTNAATVEEIQVLGIGAPAEYGNMSGAAFNVVTKSGTNEFAGSFDWYEQTDGLTDENAEINGRPFKRDGVPRSHLHPRRADPTRQGLVLRRLPERARRLLGARRRSELSELVSLGSLRPEDHRVDQRQQHDRREVPQRRLRLDLRRRLRRPRRDRQRVRQQPGLGPALPVGC